MAVLRAWSGQDVHMSQLDDIIPAEIKNDQFYDLIRSLAENETLTNVLEIGSSSGAGSTEAFVRGLSRNTNSPKLFCLEVSKARHQALHARYRDNSFVHVYNASSVPIEKFMSSADVAQFYRDNHTNLNQYPLDQILGWLEQDIKYVTESGALPNGIEQIKKDHRIDWFDLVLIDGSAFTGMAELSEVIGAEHILLDDINDIKCLDAYKRLKSDPNYTLVCEDWTLRNGFAYFRRTSRLRRENIPTQRVAASTAHLPLHIFTIVLNGLPFIRHHIEVFRRIEGPWHWHIVEGVAELVHDTAWSVELGGRIDAEVHNQGLSRDGTSAYLDQLEAAFPENISIYRRPPGKFWSGKLEMVNAPLSKISEECLLLQVDSDELWSVGQINQLRNMFQAKPENTAAYFFCDYYVGDSLQITSRNTYGNNSSYEWLRAWRYRPGDLWAAHEPPRLCRPTGRGSEVVDLAMINPIMHAETEQAGLVFQHYAYATIEQLEFKKSYYGYATAIDDWKKLQSSSNFPARLSDYFSWVKDGAVVDRVNLASTHILARKAVDSSWIFWPYGIRDSRLSPRVSEEVKAEPQSSPVTSRLSDPKYQPETILLVRTDAIGDLVMTTALLRHLRGRFPNSSVILVCQEHIAPLFKHCPYLSSVFSFNKARLIASEDYQIQITSALQALRPKLAINGIVSPDTIAHLLTLGSGSSETIGVVGDTCNIEVRVQKTAENQYTYLLPYVPGTSEMTNHRILLECLGVPQVQLHPELWLDAADERYVDQFFAENGLHPDRTIAVFAAAQFPQKNYADFGSALKSFCQSRSYSVLALGDDKASELNQFICQSSGVPAINASGKFSLSQSAIALKRSKLALGVDTSLAHMACAVGTRNVVVMGGGHFGRFMPYSALTSLVCLPLDCYGCNWYCRHERVHCVQDIRPDTIHRALVDTESMTPTKPRIYLQQALLEKRAVQYHSPESLVDCDVEYIRI